MKPNSICHAPARKLARRLGGLALAGLCLLAGGLSAPVQAAEVRIQHRGLTLNADFAPLATTPERMVLITHGGLGHRGMETIASLQSLLRERGHGTLAINLGLEIDDRHGMYDCQATHRHRYSDAADEIGAWLDWLRGRGVREVVLLGHSRGAAQTALFAATRDHGLVTAVALLTPDTRETNDAAAYQRRHGQPLAPILDRAQALVRAGKGSTLLERTGILYCGDTTVSADAFVSYYGPDPRLDTAHLIPAIRKPLLLVIAGDDEVVVNNAKFAPLADGKRVRLHTLDGAGHFPRDFHADDAADAVDVFLKSLAGATR